MQDTISIIEGTIVALEYKISERRRLLASRPTINSEDRILLELAEQLERLYNERSAALRSID
jgi:hypothetical protein